MAESTQKKLSRIRPPRVQITYDVETGDAIEKKELPMVVGIMADLAGQPKEPLPWLKDRKFVDIDRDNFNQVMDSIKPRASFRVDNTLEEGDGTMSVDLSFQSIDDFLPAAIVEQVPALKELYDARTRLNDLLAKLDGNDDLEALLHDVASNTEKRDQLRSEAPKQESQGAADGAEASDAADGGKDGDKKDDKGAAKKGGK